MRSARPITHTAITFAGQIGPEWMRSRLPGFGARSPGEERLYVALVQASDGVRLSTVTSTRAELVRQLADYVRERSAMALWEADSRRVQLLLHEGRLARAIREYFERVGNRWDEEWLVTTRIRVEPQGSGDRPAAA